MSDKKTINWIPFGESEIGASHIRKELPNQDAFRDFKGTEIDGKAQPSVITVSDGHGGTKYIRSGEGSRLAAETMSDLAASMARVLRQERIRMSEADEFAEHIKTQLLNKWQRAVDEHYGQNPFTDEEIAFLTTNCSQKDCDSVLESHKTAYGCTFLSAAAYSDMVLIFQYGDGDVLGLYPDGRTKELVIADSRNIGNETLSLCKLTNPAEIQHTVLVGGDIPELITISTDGVKNSFDDLSEETQSGFYKIPGDLKNLLLKYECNTDEVRGVLKTELARITKYGAGDDVTIGVLFNKDAIGQIL